MKIITEILREMDKAKKDGELSFEMKEKIIEKYLNKYLVLGELRRKLMRELEECL
jgi:hypothetical protein